MAARARALALLLLAVVGLCLYVAFDAVRPPAPLGRDGHRVPNDEEPPALASAPRAPSSAAAVPPDAGALAVTLRARDRAGTAVATAVRFRAVDVRENREVALIETAPSEARLVDPILERTYWIAAASQDRSWLALQGERHSWSAPGHVTVDLHLAPAGAVAGQVLSSDGRPLAGVPMRFSSGDGGSVPTAVTDDEGVFRVRGLVGHCRVTASPPDRAVCTLAVLVPPGELIDGLRLVCERALRIRGRVADSSGTPLVGVVYLFDDSIRHEATTVDGAFDFANVRPHAVTRPRYRLAWWSPEDDRQASASLEDLPWSGDVADVGTVRMDVTHRRSIDVVDQDGRTVPGLELTLTPTSGAGLAAARERTDSGGRATLRLHPGRYRVRAEGLPFSDPPFVDVERGSPSEVRITIRNTLRVQGRLVCEGATSDAGMGQFAVRVSTSGEPRVDLVSPVGNDGSFVLTVPVGVPSYALDVVVGRSAWTSVGGFTPGMEDLQVKVAPDAAISRRIVVVEEETGDPISVYTIQLAGVNSLGESTIARDVVSGDGSTLFWPLRPGSYRVLVRTPDGREASRDAVAWQGRDETVLRIAVARSR